MEKGDLASPFWPARVAELCSVAAQLATTEDCLPEAQQEEARELQVAQHQQEGLGLGHLPWRMLL